MKKATIYLINLYKLFFSKILVLFFGRGCRFSPTCSEYSKEAVRKFGLFRGLALSAKRIARCHPLSKSLYFDPVPKQA